MNLNIKQVLSLMQSNCNKRKSCWKCDMSGVGSMNNRCLLHELNSALKENPQKTLKYCEGDTFQDLVLRNE